MRDFSIRKNTKVKYLDEATDLISGCANKIIQN